MIDDFLYRLSQSPTARGILTPVARSYLRYAPWMLGKEVLWNRVVNPYLAWQSHPFIATTVFGARLAGDTRDMIQQYIYYFGLWEPHLTDWITSQLRPGDTFVDVGANVGYYSLLASRLVDASGSVVAIEASPAIFRELQANLARNRVTNVRAVNLAASARRGKVRLFRGPGYNLGETSLFESSGGGPMGDTESALLEEILEPCELAHARCIKLDIEGAEGAVLPGLIPRLNSGRADLELIVEFHPQFLIEPGQRVGELVELLRIAGFHAYRMENDYWPLNYFREAKAKRPVRLDAAIQNETVVVFSRREGKTL
jgi:FkbM family methyltransferase